MLHLAAAGSGSAGGECAALNVELAHLNADVDALSRSVGELYGSMGERVNGSMTNRWPH